MPSQIHFQIGKCRQFIPQIVSLALQVYREENVSSITKYYSLYDKCPESFIVALDPKTNKVLGYIISIPFSRFYFNQTIKPDYNEDGLNHNDIRPFQKGNNLVYLFSIVTKPDYINRTGVLSGLSRTLRDQFKTMASQGIYITEASALALSDSGIKICHGLKMQTMGSNAHGTVFYNSQFYKLFVDMESKNEIIKNFIHNRKFERLEEERRVDRINSLLPRTNRDLDYDVYWIANVIESNTIKNNEFKNWIKGCEYRYSSGALSRMEYIWNLRKNNLQLINSLERAS